jgi:hypothetical protein
MSGYSVMVTMRSCFEFRHRSVTLFLFAQSHGRSHVDVRDMLDLSGEEIHLRTFRGTQGGKEF